MSEPRKLPRKSLVPVAMPSSRIPATALPVGREAPAGEGGITPQLLLHAVSRWWKSMVPLGVVLAIGAAALVYAFFKPVYQATAWLQVHEAPPVAVLDLSGKSPEQKSFVATQLELLRSELVLTPALRDPEVAKVPEIAGHEGPKQLEWLAKVLGVVQVGTSELFKVSFDAAAPHDSAKVVNAVIDSYFALRQRTEERQTEKVLALLNQEKESRTQEVLRLRGKIDQLTKQANLQDLGLTNGDAKLTLNAQADKLRDQIVASELQRVELEARLKVAEETAASRPPLVSEALVERDLEANATYIKMRTEIEEKRRQVTDAKAAIDPNRHSAFFDQELERMDREIKQQEQSLQSFRNELAVQLRRQKAALEQENRQLEIAKLRTDVLAVKQRQAILQRQYDEEMKSLAKTGGLLAELDARKAEMDFASRVLDRISDRTWQLRTEHPVPGQVIQLQSATPPDLPVEWFPLLKMALAFLAVIWMPLGIAVVWEAIARRVHGTKNLAQESKLAVLGEVARLPVSRANSRGKLSRRARHELQIFEESIDSLRTGLLLSNDLRDMKVLAVTSASKHEGKTSVAVQLAISIARSTSQPTLLIDGDLRSPDIHNAFNLTRSPGLAEVLDHRATLDEAIVTTWSDHLHLLPAGKLETNPHKLVGNGALRNVLEQATSRYRYVIVDTPPVLAAAESLVLAKSADACLLCAMRDVSRADQVRKACERLVVCGARPVGTILNGVSPKSYSYHYGTYASA